jgi:hypothetical protein
MLPVVLVLACVACAIDACGGAGWRFTLDGRSVRNGDRLIDASQGELF